MGAPEEEEEEKESESDGPASLPSPGPAQPVRAEQRRGNVGGSSLWRQALPLSSGPRTGEGAQWGRVGPEDAGRWVSQVPRQQYPWMRLSLKGRGAMRGCWAGGGGGWLGGGGVITTPEAPRAGGGGGRWGLGRTGTPKPSPALGVHLPGGSSQGKGPPQPVLRGGEPGLGVLSRVLPPSPCKALAAGCGWGREIEQGLGSVGTALGKRGRRVLLCPSCL